jgi:hypothetical protein
VVTLQQFHTFHCHPEPKTMSNVRIERLSAAGTTSTSAPKPSKRPSYGGSYMPLNVEHDLVTFYEKAPAMEMAAFCKSETTIPRTTFIRHYNSSGLSQLKSEDKPIEVARAAAAKYTRGLAIGKKKRTAKASALNRYLTEQEELSLVQIIRLLASIGHGVTKPDVMSLIDEYVNLEEDDRNSVEISESVFRGLMSRHKDLIKLVNSGSLCPSRARKANTETRDKVFFKMDAYVRSLNAMGKVPWKNFSEVPKDVIYNMDEVGNDTTKRRSKVLADRETPARLFQVTPEGDGKMNMHITACITTRADGKQVDWWVGPHDGARGGGGWFCFSLVFFSIPRPLCRQESWY